MLPEALLQGHHRGGCGVDLRLPDLDEERDEFGQLGALPEVFVDALHSEVENVVVVQFIFISLDNEVQEGFEHE